MEAEGSQDLLILDDQAHLVEQQPAADYQEDNDSLSQHEDLMNHHDEESMEEARMADKSLLSSNTSQQQHDSSLDGMEDEEEVQTIDDDDDSNEASQERADGEQQPNDEEVNGSKNDHADDLSALKNRLQELIEEEPAIPMEESGFPIAFKGSVVVGKFIPINKKTWSNIEVTAEDSILDCPSQVVPLLIKKPDIFPLQLPKPDQDSKGKSALKSKKKKKVRFDGDNEVHDGDDDDFVPDSEDLDQDSEDIDDEEQEILDPEMKAAEEERKKRMEAMIEQQKSTTMLTISDFYKSSLGNMLLGVGLSRATEWFHRDAIKQLHKAIHKEGELEEYMEEMTKQKALHQQCKQANSIFVFPPRKCTICDFKTESLVGLEQHMSVPHLSNKREYKCNYCPFSTRDPRTTLYHYQSVHNKPCTIEPPAQLYECPVCPYESSQKQKAAAHVAKCQKFFVPERVQHMPDPETDYPAVTPRPIGQMDIKIYQTTLSTLRVVALTPNFKLPDIPGLPRGLQAQMLLMTQQQLAQEARNRPKQQPFMNQRNQLAIQSGRSG